MRRRARKVADENGKRELLGRDDSVERVSQEFSVGKTVSLGLEKRKQKAGGHGCGGGRRTSGARSKTRIAGPHWHARDF